MWEAFTHTEAMLASGQKALPSSDLFSQHFQAHPQHSQVFDTHMMNRTVDLGLLHKIPALCDWGRFRHIVDVGGGLGHVLQAAPRPDPNPNPNPNQPHAV